MTAAGSAVLRITAAAILAAILPACGGDVEKPKEGTPAREAAADEGAKHEAARAKNEIGELEKRAIAAIAGGDPREAERLVALGISRAEGNGPELETARGRFLLLRGDLARDAGRTIDARRDYADAMALFRVAQHDDGRFRVFISEAALEEIQGDYAAAERELGEAEELLGKIGDEALRGVYKRQLGRLAFVRARYPDACALFNEAIEAFSHAKDKREQAETLLLLAMAEDGGGDSPLARRTLDKAAALFTEIGDKDGQVRALHRLAGFAERDFQFAKARALLTKVRALYEELGRRSDAATVARHLEALPEGAK